MSYVGNAKERLDEFPSFLAIGGEILCTFGAMEGPQPYIETYGCIRWP